MNKKDKTTITTTLLFILIICISIFSNKIYAQSVNTEIIKQTIDSHTDKIKKLDEEIKIYTKQIEVIGTEAKTLKSAVQILDINQKKIGTEIKKTESNISNTNSSIQKLNSEIKNIESKLDTNKGAISKTIAEIRAKDDRSLIETILTNKSLTDVLGEYESMEQFREEVRAKSKELEQNKIDLENKKNQTEKKKIELVSLKGELSDKNEILAINKKEKNSLLTETKNKETVFKNILANRQAEKEKFEKELFAFESELKRSIDPNSFPSGKKGILSWPLENITVTQYFGRTADAKRLYTSGTHNGVDFRASRGTKVMSVLEGTVQGTGNTDAQRGCYSYGKWVLIKHPNGLTSLYAHLDLIKVEAGERVSTGQTIGYSGQTGYATGPHLHLTLYASQGVEIQRYTSSKNCKNVDIPVSDRSAYLDPMLYF